MCPLVKELQKHKNEFKTIVCVTGQHREMLDQVLQIFDVKPDYDLNIMKQGQDLYDITAQSKHKAITLHKKIIATVREMHDKYSETEYNDGMTNNSRETIVGN